MGDFNQSAVAIDLQEEGCGDMDWIELT